MTTWHLANLSREQHQVLQDLEDRTGLTLIAYTRDGRRGGAAVDFRGIAQEEFGTELALGAIYSDDIDGPHPEMLNALMETYRSGAAADNTTVRRGRRA